MFAFLNIFKICFAILHAQIPSGLLMACVSARVDVLAPKSRSFLLSILSSDSDVDHRITLWIEGDHTDMRVIARSVKSTVWLSQFIDVVPPQEFSRPGTCDLQASEALGWEFGPVLDGTEQRPGIGVVVAHARPRVRGLHSSPGSTI